MPNPTAGSDPDLIKLRPGEALCCRTLIGNGICVMWGFVSSSGFFVASILKEENDSNEAGSGTVSATMGIKPSCEGARSGAAVSEGVGSVATGFEAPICEASDSKAIGWEAAASAFVGATGSEVLGSAVGDSEVADSDTIGSEEMGFGALGSGATG
jgi:hypothetical protein